MWKAIRNPDNTQQLVIVNEETKQAFSVIPFSPVYLGQTFLSTDAFARSATPILEIPKHWFKESAGVKFVPSPVIGPKTEGVETSGDEIVSFDEETENFVKGEKKPLIDTPPLKQFELTAKIRKVGRPRK